MTADDFEKLLKAHKMRGARTVNALRLVFVDGVTAYAASKTVGIAESAISRAKQKLQRPLCPHCGQPMP